MDRAIAFFFVAVGAVYSELGSDDLWHGYALPALFVLGLLYLFWYRGFLAIAAGAAAFHFMDVNSASLFKGLVLPIFFGVCVLYLMWWAGTSGFSGGDSFGSGDGGCGWGDGGGECGGDGGGA